MRGKRLLTVLIGGLIATGPLYAVQLAAPARMLSAATAITVYESRGVHRARLGQTDRTARSRVGLRCVRSGRDNNYAGQVVYYFYFGRRVGSHYEVQMYSKRNRRVWLFAIYSTRLYTSKGVRVGTTESVLRRRYGSALHRRVSRTYTRYYLGRLRGVGTDFYVRRSTRRVAFIYVRNW